MRRPTVFVATSASATEPLKLVELSRLPLTPDTLRVRVRAVGVNPVDWKMREGGPLRMVQRVLGPSGPLVVGVDFAGEVTEVGASVTGVSVGARVVGGTDFSRGQRGSYADEVLVRADQCVTLPDAVTFDDAACLPIPGATAWRALVEVAELPRRSDARVLVLGAAGGVGVVTVQLARSLGAAVWGVCSTRNTALVAGFGATPIDHTAGDALAAARAHGPFDVVVNAVGTTAYPLAACASLVKPDGVVALVVVSPSDYPSLALTRRARVVFGRPTRARLDGLVAALTRGDLRPVIEAVFPLAEAEAAHQRSRAGKVVGKLLLHPA